ncbi:MAG TPA: YncE family protein [Lacipirellulaceae bacterium]|jgi:DNA-binding beta-propeller fold protein YncE
MMSSCRRFVLLVTSIAMLLALAPVTHADGPYHFIKEIPIGGEGGWDYLAVDEASRRIYVSHATKVVVIDLDKDEVAGEIADTPGVHGIAIAPKLDRVFVSNGRESKASVVDSKTLATLMKVDTGPNPDAILYEPSQQEVYTFNGRGKSATVFAADSGKAVATIELSGKPEFAVYDPSSGRVYNNIEDKSEVVAIDTKMHKVVDTWPIAPGESASGMAFDAAHHRLFLGCDNKMMVMMDSASGKVITNVPIGEGVDANAFDPATQLAFSSNGEGNVTIAHEDAPDKLTVVQTLETERGARTMTLDPSTHKIYLSSAKSEPAEPGQRRPKMVAGSFKVLVYGM